MKGIERMFTPIRRAALAGLAIIALCSGSAVQAVTAPRAVKPEPLFERNVGQYPEGILYRGRLGHFDAGLRADGSLQLLGRRAVRERDGARPVRIVPAGASMPREVRPEQRSEYHTNYFLRGDGASRDYTDVPHFGRVVYRSIYDGIDLAYHFGEGRLEFDFIVAPGKDPGVIALQVEGATELRLDEQGDLLIAAGRDVIRHKRPVAYQVRYGTRMPVACAYRLEAGDRVALALGDYDPTLELVVDPVVEYASYLGGENWEEARAVRIGPGGFVYATGRTISTKFPSLNAEDGGVNGVDVFVTKINPATGKLVYSTFLGGGSDDEPSALAVDAQGAVYVVGMGRTRFPTTRGAYQTGSSFDGFLTKIAPAGNALGYSTFLFGTTPRGVAVDASGQAVVTGVAGSAFVTTAGAFQAAYGGGSSDPRQGDGFLLKMNTAGTGPVFATFLGGPGDDDANAVALDLAGRIVVVGAFFAPHGIPLVRPYLIQPAGGGMLAAFDANATSVAYSTNFPSHLTGVAVDPYGNLVTVGRAGNSVPMVNPVLTPGQMLPAGSLGGFSKPMLAKFALRENLELVFSTYYGSRYDCCEAPAGLGVDAMGDMYVAVEVDGTRMGSLVELHPFMSTAYTTAKIPDPRYEAIVAAGFAREGGRLLFQTIVTPCGASVCSRGADIHAGGVGQVAVVGSTDITWYPVAANNHQAAHANSGFQEDVFVMTLGLENPPLKLESSAASAVAGSPVTLKATSYVPGASGSVEFVNGDTVLGSVPMIEGVATLQVSLPAGVGRLGARLGGTTAAPLLVPVRAVTGSCP